MPRASLRPPPVTRCGPRNTSPANVTTGSGVIRMFHDDVLEQIAEGCFDGALVAGVDLEVIGDRPLLPDLTVGLCEQRPRGVVVAGARGFELFERFQARLEPCQIVFART